jgi:hypothetical protein
LTYFEGTRIMTAELKKCFITLAVVVVSVILLSCGPAGTGGGGNSTPVSQSTPGEIDATLYWFSGGGLNPVPCTHPSEPWTANSPAGSTQDKTSPAVEPGDNVSTVCEKYKDIEGAELTDCGCPIKVRFTSLAPDTWTVAVHIVTCPIKGRAWQDGGGQDV